MTHSVQAQAAIQTVNGVSPELATPATAMLAITTRNVLTGQRSALLPYAAVVVHALREGQSNVRGYATALKVGMMREAFILDNPDTYSTMTPEAQAQAQALYESRFKRLCDKSVGISAKAAEFGLETGLVHEMEQQDAINHVHAWFLGMNIHHVDTLYEHFGYKSTRKEKKTPEVSVNTPATGDEIGNDQTPESADDVITMSIDEYANEVLSVLAGMDDADKLAFATMLKLPIDSIIANAMQNQAVTA